MSRYGKPRGVRCLCGYAIYGLSSCATACVGARLHEILNSAVQVTADTGGAAGANTPAAPEVNLEAIF